MFKIRDSEIPRSFFLIAEITRLGLNLPRLNIFERPFVTPLIQNEGIHLIKHRQIQTFKLKKLELIFFLIKAISTMLKYKGSWPSLGFHGVIFVYISQTLMNSFWFWLLRNELLPKLNNFYLNYALSFIVGQAKRAQSYSRTNEELVLVGAIHNPQGNQIV